MKIASIGRDFADNEVTNIDYNSSRTVLEFDSLLIDTAGLAQQGLNKAAQTFRHNEFTDFLSLGRTIVVFMGNNSVDAYIPIKPLALKPLSGTSPDFKGPDFLRSFWATVQSDMQYLVQIENEACLGKPFLFIPSTNRPVATWIKHEGGKHSASAVFIV